MTPTAKLRFVEREVIVSDAQMIAKNVRILQQWWEWPDSFDVITAQPAGEWRDVPLEKEKS